MDYTHYIIMFFIMIISGFLSTMNIWVDKYDDIRFSINDIYMTLLMTGWMFLFMGMVYKDLTITSVGVCMVLINVWCIRTQFMVTNEQYLRGMIPHHSMAILMSKKLLEKSPKLKEFLQTIIATQEQEINYMKQMS